MLCNGNVFLHGLGCLGEVCVYDMFNLGTLDVTDGYDVDHPSVVERLVSLLRAH